MSTVLVVDDKDMLRDSVASTLARAGMQVFTAASAAEALASIAKARPSCMITDLKMPGMDGLELIEAVKKLDDELPVVLMTAFGTIETAVKAMRLGAFDYITKPFEGDELIITIKRAIEHGRLVRENAILKNAQPAEGPRAASGAKLVGLHRLVGDSPVMRRVKEQVLAVAESHGTVLICGESGTGKEVIARAIHELSPRDGQAFLGVNCAALSETLLESELFGHEKGAFTGADKLRKGRFELAERGTLLLDEISEMPLRLQAKLLRVLQERVFERVGSSTTIGCDVRVIATSNRDLPRSVSKQEFRQDLFFRLNVLPVHLPPLRDRLEDVPALVSHFMQQIELRDGKAGMRFSDDAIVAMQAYAWPGNVRELQNICERAAVLSRSEIIGPELIRPWLGQGLVVLAGPAMSLGRIDGHETHADRSVRHDAEPVHAGSNGHASYTSNGHHGASQGGYVGSNGQAAHARVSEAEVITSAAPAINDRLPAGFTEAKPSSEMTTEQVAILDRRLEDIERDVIVTTLKRFAGHRARTAQALGIGVRTLGLKLKKWKSENLVENEL
jgi:DNA-binding NtrC family response regulator